MTLDRPVRVVDALIPLQRVSQLFLANGEVAIVVLEVELATRAPVLNGRLHAVDDVPRVTAQVLDLTVGVCGRTPVNYGFGPTFLEVGVVLDARVTHSSHSEGKAAVRTDLVAAVQLIAVRSGTEASVLRVLVGHWVEATGWPLNTELLTIHNSSVKDC